MIYFLVFFQFAPGYTDAGTTPTGKAMLQMMSVIAELERNLLAERVKEGIIASRSRGTTVGRPKLPQEKVNVAMRMYNSGEYSIKEIVANAGISQGTLYREINKMRLQQIDSKKNEDLT